MIFDRHANLKYKYGNRHFWASGYYVDTVGRNKKQIQEYIKHQLDEDHVADQLSLKEYMTRLRVARIRKHNNNPLRGSLKKKCSRQTFFGAPLGVSSVKCPSRAYSNLLLSRRF